MSFRFDILPYLTGQRPTAIRVQDPGTSQVLDRPVGTRQAPASSYLGTPVVDNIRFNAGNYTSRTGELITYQGLTIDTVIMSVELPKNIVRTPVAGRPGTVKEYISDDDYRVRIDGGFYLRDRYPQDEVDRLVALCSVPAALEVVSPFLQLFGIYQLVIEQYTFNQIPGNEYVQTFSMSAVSDRPVELLRNEER